MPLVAKVALAAVAGIFLVAFIASFFRGRPPETYFFCARCKISTRHNDRTIEAWRNQKTRFYCQKCHAAWLQSHPPATNRLAREDGGAGCLGIVVVGLIAAGSSVVALLQLS